MPPGQRVAVIGSGIAGLASAACLSVRHRVVLFEAADTLGGHAHTVDVELEGRSVAVDTGFLVFNDRTYPLLMGLFEQLQVPTHASDMSFGVSLDQGALEWAGTNLNTVFAQRHHLLSPRFLGMLADLLRLNRQSHAHLAQCADGRMTLQDLLEQGRFGRALRDAYLLPMAAAIWSSPTGEILKFPAATFLRFCINHGLLQIEGRPRWYTVEGGSREYVRRLAQRVPDIRLSTPVEAVQRASSGVLVRSAGQDEAFDHVVLATHAPDSLRLLVDADDAETEVLAAVRYQPNETILHTDQGLMPRRRRVWSAWNYLGQRAGDGQRPVSVTYWINRLQPLPVQTPVLVTLNPFEAPRPETVLGRYRYDHPLFDHPALQAQARLPGIQGRRKTWFAGAWTGYGFHEDGLASAVRVVEGFGVRPTWAVRT